MNTTAETAPEAPTAEYSGLSFFLITVEIEESSIPYFDSATIIIWSVIAGYGGVLYYRGGERKKETQNVASDAANNEPEKELNN